MSKYIELSRALMYIADIQLSVSDASKPTIAPRDLCEWIFEGIKDLPTIEVSEDCISREWLKGHIEKVSYKNEWHMTETDEFVSWENIENAPSVVPKLDK